MKNKFEGCIVGMAVGDALGAPVEFMRSYDEIMNATKDVGVNDLPDPALFTDDTQMSICVAQALIDSNGDHAKFMKGLGKYFVKWYKLQNPGSPSRRAPGNSCLAGCKNLDEGAPWQHSGVDSKGCGSAMRSAPIGLYHHDNMLKVIEWARDSSIPTHNNPVACAASAGTALLTHLALKEVPVGLWAHELKGPLGGVCSMPGDHDASMLPGAEQEHRDEFMEVIQRAAEAAGNREDPWAVMRDGDLGEAWLGHEAVASALYCCMMNPDDYRGAVLMGANTVGDSDSIACITGAIMGARLGIEAIPEDWVEKIEAKNALLGMAGKLYESSRCHHGIEECPGGPSCTSDHK